MGLLSGAGSALLSAPALNFYIHDGWRLAFRHRPAAKGHEQDAPLLLIHPVGVGLSAWFWERMMDRWDGGAVYAPDLIGCGASDEWAPDERGMFLPLDWSRGVEALWRQHVRQPCVVVAQGGLAPVRAARLRWATTSTTRPSHVNDPSARSACSSQRGKPTIGAAQRPSLGSCSLRRRRGPT